MSEIWGDDVQCVCRMILQNVNGGLSDKTPSIATTAKALKADIIGLVETKTNWKYRNTLETIQKQWNQEFGQIKMVTSTSDAECDSRCQYGGTMTVVGSSWARRTKAKSDESGLGRWTEAEISGNDSRLLCVFTVYAVGKNNIAKCGPRTTYSQQWNLLNKDNDTFIDPREKLFQDLGNEIRKRQQAGNEVIVMMDANDTLQKPTSKLGTWVNELKLLDVHCEIHGGNGEPATHSRGKHRIDYILATKPILKYIKKATILPLYKFTQSDHRALLIDVDLDGFLKVSTVENMLAELNLNDGYKPAAKATSSNVANGLQFTIEGNGRSHNVVLTEAEPTMVIDSCLRSGDNNLFLPGWNGKLQLTLWSKVPKAIQVVPVPTGKQGCEIKVSDNVVPPSGDVANFGHLITFGPYSIRKVQLLTESQDFKETLPTNPFLVLKLKSPDSMKGTAFVLEQGVSDTLTIGSDGPSMKTKSGWICFPIEHLVEPKHARVSLVILRDGTQMVEVQDLKSSSGTFVSGQRIPTGKKGMAFCNHSVRVGNVELVVANQL